jgi:hypothetical protein
MPSPGEIDNAHSVRGNADCHRLIAGLDKL